MQRRDRVIPPPYAYCGGNPVNAIDPDGRDIWEINSMGKVVNREKDLTQDTFHILDADGKRMDGKSLMLSYGTVKSMDSGNTIWNVGYDTYEVARDAYSSSLFEFLAENTAVEWSHALTGESGKTGQNFITTSHMEKSEHGISDLLYKKLRFLNLREYNHSHPGNIGIPSGLDYPSSLRDKDKIGDIQLLDYIHSLIGKEPRAFIYLPKDKRYIKYDRNSRRKDFNSQIKVHVLDDIIIMP